MNKFIVSSVAAAAVLAAGSAFAFDIKPEYYGNVSVSSFDTKAGTVKALGLRAGAKLTKYFGAEIEGEGNLFGAKEGVKTSLRNTVAGYAVAFLPVSEKLDLIARVGYGNTEGKILVGKTTYKYSEESVNYGLGAQYNFDTKNSVRADYTLVDYDTAAFGTGKKTTVSYVRKF